MLVILRATSPILANTNPASSAPKPASCHYPSNTRSVHSYYRCSAALARRAVSSSLILIRITASRSVFPSLHRALSALGPTYPLLWDLRERYLLLQPPIYVNSLLGVKTRFPRYPGSRRRTRTSCFRIFVFCIIVIQLSLSSASTSPSFILLEAKERHRPALLPPALKSSTTTTDEEGPDEGDILADQKDLIILEKRKPVVHDAKPVKPALRHACSKPLSLDVREDKYEKEGDQDEDSEDKTGTVIIGKVLFMGAATLPRTSEWTYK
ncbi:hypothetical protein DL96DRAFT_1721808 [Flagelloscypha sp. PMI_526]|nr:hypothetical protein DL96DRAFT_1721808 [Flagelloscypha sp. PMI_526]